MAGRVFEDGEVLSAQKINDYLNHSVLEPKTYTPTVAGITGTSVTATYQRIGSLVTVEFLLTVGSAAGTALWRLGTPTLQAMGGSNHALGVAMAIDASVGHASRRGLTIYRADDDEVAFLVDGLTTNGSISGNTTPWTWASGDTIGGRFTYWEA